MSLYTSFAAELLRALEEAAQDTALAMDAEFAADIRTAIWDWPNPPSPRDIVETGNLAASQRPPRIATAPAALAVDFVWTATYSIFVHEGYVRNSGNGELRFPARPWTRTTLSRIDWAGVWAQNVRKRLGA